jgi:hypothetical protein
MSTSAERAWFQKLPPRDAGKQKPVALALGSNSIATVWGADAPKNKCFLAIENASAAAITVGFGGTATATNGAVIPAGDTRMFWITPSRDLNIAVSAICSAYVCSPEYEGPAY